MKERKKAGRKEGMEERRETRYTPTHLKVLKTSLQGCTRTLITSEKEMASEWHAKVQVWVGK